MEPLAFDDLPEQALLLMDSAPMQIFLVCQLIDPIRLIDWKSQLLRNPARPAGLFNALN